MKNKRLRVQPVKNDTQMREIGQSYRLQYILCRVLDIEYSTWLDIDFKNPRIHNHIKKAVESLNEVQKHTNIVLDSESNSDNVLEALCDLHGIIHMLCQMDNDQLQAMAKGMKHILENGYGEQAVA